MVLLLHILLFVGEIMGNNRRFFIVLATIALLNTISCKKKKEAETPPSSNDGASRTIRDGQNFPFANLHQGFTCQAVFEGGNLWLRSFFQGRTQFVYRIGAGGAVGEMRDALDNNANMQSAKTGPNDNTDRVFQDVYWSHIRTPVLSPWNEDSRFNVNQAGSDRHAGRLGLETPTLAVIRYKNSPGCAVDIYSAPQHQWIAPYDQYMRGVFTLRTSYQFTRSGFLTIRQTVLLSHLNLTGASGGQGQGLQSMMPHFLINGWLPFSARFSAATYNLSSSGIPQGFVNMPNINQWRIANIVDTRGYTVLYNLNAPATNTAMGVAFGRKRAVCPGNSSCIADDAQFISTMSWNETATIRGAVIMPGLLTGDTPIGTTIDRTYVIMPYRGLNSYFARELEQTANEVPESQIFYPGVSVNAANQALLNKLRSYQTEAIAGTGYRGDQLGNSGRIIEAEYDQTGWSAPVAPPATPTPTQRPTPTPAPAATPTPPPVQAATPSVWAQVNGRHINVSFQNAPVTGVSGRFYNIESGQLYYWGSSTGPNNSVVFPKVNPGIYESQLLHNGNVIARSSQYYTVTGPIISVQVSGRNVTLNFRNAPNVSGQQLQWYPNQAGAVYYYANWSGSSGAVTFNNANPGVYRAIFYINGEEQYTGPEYTVY